MQLRYRFLMLLLFCSSSCLAARMSQDEFAPAVFEGLTVGKATVATVTQRFGNPSDRLRDRTGATWLYYNDIGPVPGRVEVVSGTNSQTIDFVTVYPNDLSLDDAKKILGSDFKVTRYAFDECLANGGEAPLYESASGPLEFFVYARRGIAFRAQGNRVTEIEYMRRPVGAKESRCKANSLRRPIR
jgi:hypothetical protein